MSSLRQTVSFCTLSAVSLIALAVSCVTLVDLFSFLSGAAHVKAQNVPLRSNNKWAWASWHLLVDQALLSLFILQHSIISLSGFKEWKVFEEFKVARRSVYVISTCLALQVLMRYWHPVSDLVLWDFSQNLPWLFSTVHAMAWIVIYAGTVVVDPAELLGIKQVYYCVRNFGDPSDYKSHDLRRLLAHARHPSFLGFCVIFWFIPIMSLDRLLLAVILTAYMSISWNVDDRDFHYQKLQHRRKFRELVHVN